MLKRKWSAAVAAIGVVATIALVAQKKGTARAAPPPPPPPPPVSAAIAVVREHAPRKTYTGVLSAVQSVELKPRVSGYISAVSAPEGELVREGHRLFLLDPAPFRARLAAARATTQGAQARLELARAESSRASTLVQRGAVTQESAERAAATLAETQAQVAAARAAEQLASLELAYTSVTAPIAGRVGKVLVTRGNLVAGGEAASVLTTVVAIDPLYVEFNVDEPTYLAAIAGTQGRGPATSLPVGVRLEDGSRRDAKLSFVGNRLDRSTGTIPARATLANPDGRLTPGLFAEVELAIGSVKPAILVSDVAIGSEQGGRFVLVLDGNNTTQYRPVTLGGTLDGLRVVETGIQAGERILLKGLAGPGMKVEPTLVPMSARAATEGPTTKQEATP